MRSGRSSPAVRFLSAIQEWKTRRFAHYNARKHARENHDFRLGVLGIMKNEELNVREWVEHYIWQGAERIYLIDNGSTDRSVELVQPWVEKGLVKLISLPEPQRQREHYMKAVKVFEIPRQCEWLLVADLDEFWFCKDGTGLADTLSGYNEADVIYVGWSIFGSSGYIEHPDSIRTRLVMRHDRNTSRELGKWVCRTGAIRRVKNINIHHIHGTFSSRTVTDNDTFQINHYQIQSLEFFKKSKMQRGDAVHQNNARTLEYFEEIDRKAINEDRALAEMVLRAKADAASESADQADQDGVSIVGG